MLGKLIKHDFKATGRLLLPILIAVAILTPLTALTTGFDYEEYFPELAATIFTIMSGLMMAAYIIALIAMFICCTIFIAYYFYKTMVSDEAYLTHTLPVATWKLIVAKLITAFCYMVISSVVLLLSILVFVLISVRPEASQIANAIEQFKMLFQEVWTILDTPLLFALASILLLIFSTLSGILHIYCSFALGQRFKKHRLGGAVCVYVIINIAMQTISTVLIYVYFFLFFSIAKANDPVAYQNFMHSNNAVQDPLFNDFWLAYMGFLLLMQVIYSVVMYVLTVHSFSKKLNLE